MLGLACGSSIVVEHLTHHPRVNGLNLANAVGTEGESGENNNNDKKRILGLLL
jgi:hypothetical protein